MKRILTFAVALTTAFTMLRAQSPYADYYANLPVEMQQVEPLAFRNVEINIANLGAVADGKTNVGEIINKVIKKLSKQGGGHVIIPAGTWLTGPIRLYSNIDLHLEDGATLLFSTDKELYVQKSDSLRDGSKKCNACVYGSKLENVAITGNGTLDGQGIYWRPIKEKKIKKTDPQVWDEVLAMGGTLRPDDKKYSIWYPFNLNKELGVPNIAKDVIAQEKMRPHLVNITDSKSVLIQGVTLLNSPKFHLVPTRVKNLIIDGITIRCPWWAQNGDAMDPGNIQTGLIVNCNISCGDDGICMKGGVGQKGVDAGPQSDILIMNDTVYRAHGGFVIGSEFSGGMQRIVVRNCVFDGTDIGFRFKSAPGRGGWCKDIYCVDNVVRNIREDVIHIESGYADRGAGVSATDKDKKDAFFPDWSNITFRNINGAVAENVVNIQGLKGMPVHDLVFEGITIYGVTGTGVKLDYAENLLFKNCNFRTRAGYEFDIKHAGNIIYNGKDPLAE